jgi:hypothetical protein
MCHQLCPEVLTKKNVWVQMYGTAISSALKGLSLLHKNSMHFPLACNYLACAAFAFKSVVLCAELVHRDPRAKNLVWRHATERTAAVWIDLDLAANTRAKLPEGTGVQLWDEAILGPGRTYNERSDLSLLGRMMNEWAASAAWDTSSHASLRAQLMDGQLTTAAALAALQRLT